MSPFRLREFQPEDLAALQELAVAAYREFDEEVGDWPTPTRAPDRIALLAAVGELIVATTDVGIAGTVTYVGPNMPKPDWFESAWPVVRMLAVHPDYRGLGIGRALTEECVHRARRDGARIIALHTSRLLEVAVTMYERMGFSYLRESNVKGGVSYGIWVKEVR